MRYFIFTLGCQMNVSDSQRIATVLDSSGLKPASEKEADLIIVNACSVRQSAVDRIYGKLRQWQDKKVIITGCVLSCDRAKLEKKVDLIFNIKDLSKLPKWLFSSGNLQAKNYFAIQPKYLNKKEAFVPIMTGCNNFCSYCAVPYTRGREISRPEKEIICEVENLVKRGHKEITLLGQNVNSYKIKNVKVKSQNDNLKFKNKKLPFVKLLQKLVKIPGDFKIKFLTSNPWDFSDELIELIAKEPKLSKEIHLPVQSGDDEILKKMNRPYTAKKYLNLIENLKLKIENLSLSTDIIVGFPGETKKAFENTVKLCKKVGFDKAYIAMYSPRPGTTAYKFKDNVPKEEKKRRWEILNKLINKRVYRKGQLHWRCPKTLSG